MFEMQGELEISKKKWLRWKNEWEYEATMEAQEQDRHVINIISQLS